MATAFVRQLGQEPGVQLNPLRDNSEVPSIDNADQVFGIMMRATRGRIDKPFKVNRGNVRTKLGKGDQVRVNALNEAYVHVVEALNNGAYEAVVQRLVAADAAVKWAVVTVDAGTGAISYSVSATDPVAPYLFAVKHLECHNDGITIEYRADEKKVGGVTQANDVITVRLRDADGNLLYAFTGSLSPTALDDYGKSMYLPDVATSATDAVSIRVGVTGVSATVAPTSSAYGYDTAGGEKWSKSAVLACFEEGALSYVAADYTKARQALQNTIHDYAYISSGGSQAQALLAQLSQLAFDTNRQLRYDISGSLTPEAAIAFAESLNFGSAQHAHLLHAFWSPLRSADPAGLNADGVFGVATLNIAYACLRNAGTNAYGFSPKNFPIAGRNWPVARQGLVQIYSPSRQELNALARAKINPVLFDTFTGGGRFVYTDSITSALVDSSLKKLIAVADMSTSVDDAVTRFGKDVLQQPIAVATRRMQDFLTEYFSAAEASGWLVPSAAPEMNGEAWKFDVRPDATRPYDRLVVQYWLRYDGTTRQIHVTQYLTR